MSEKTELTLDMGRAPIGKLIWRMSIPSIIGVMAYNIYNLFDTIFISHGAGQTVVLGEAAHRCARSFAEGQPLAAALQHVGFFTPP